MPSPVSETTHSLNALALNVGCEQQSKAVPPQLYGLVAKIDLLWKSRSSTLRSDNGDLTYFITTRQTTSGDG